MPVSDLRTLSRLALQRASLIGLSHRDASQNTSIFGHDLTVIRDTICSTDDHNLAKAVYSINKWAIPQCPPSLFIELCVLNRQMHDIHDDEHSDPLTTLYLPYISPRDGGSDDLWTVKFARYINSTENIFRVSSFLSCTYVTAASHDLIPDATFICRPYRTVITDPSRYSGFTSDDYTIYHRLYSRVFHQSPNRSIYTMYIPDPEQEVCIITNPRFDDISLLQCGEHVRLTQNCYIVYESMIDNIWIKGYDIGISQRANGRYLNDVVYDCETGHSGYAYEQAEFRTKLEDAKVGTTYCAVFGDSNKVKYMGAFKGMGSRPLDDSGQYGRISTYNFDEDIIDYFDLSESNIKLVEVHPPYLPSSDRDPYKLRVVCPYREQFGTVHPTIGSRMYIKPNNFKSLHLRSSTETRAWFLDEVMDLTQQAYKDSGGDMVKWSTMRSYIGFSEDKHEYELTIRSIYKPDQYSMDVLDELLKFSGPLSETQKYAIAVIIHKWKCRVDVDALFVPTRSTKHFLDSYNALHEFIKPLVSSRAASTFGEIPLHPSSRSLSDMTAYLRMSIFPEPAASEPLSTVSDMNIYHNDLDYEPVCFYMNDTPICTMGFVPGECIIVKYHFDSISESIDSISLIQQMS